MKNDRDDELDQRRESRRAYRPRNKLDEDTDAELTPTQRRDEISPAFTMAELDQSMALQLEELEEVRQKVPRQCQKLKIMGKSRSNQTGRFLRKGGNEGMESHG